MAAPRSGTRGHRCRTGIMSFFAGRDVVCTAREFRAAA